MDEGAHHRGTIEELDPDQCLALLRSAPVARIVYVASGLPEVTLVNAGVEDRTVFVRCLPGTRLATALAEPGLPVLVEADDLDPATRSGWSVVGRGHMEPVLDAVAVAHLDRSVAPSWVLGDSGGTWVRIELDDVSGRRVGGAITTEG